MSYWSFQGHPEVVKLILHQVQVTENVTNLQLSLEAVILSATKAQKKGAAG